MIKNRIFTKRKRWFNGIRLVFPHTSGGDTVAEPILRKVGLVFPTRVGVILRGVAKHLLNKCFPHTCGGVFSSSAVSVLDFFCTHMQKKDSETVDIIRDESYYIIIEKTMILYHSACGRSWNHPPFLVAGGAETSLYSRLKVVSIPKVSYRFNSCRSVKK